jgi:hypothetical protein
LEKACSECGVEADRAYLYKCPICHKMICEEHKKTRSGRAFCSVHCADGFFHDEDGENDPE